MTDIFHYYNENDAKPKINDKVKLIEPQKNHDQRRGKEFIIYQVDPKKATIWVKNDESTIAFCSDAWRFQKIE